MRLESGPGAEDIAGREAQASVLPWRSRREAGFFWTEEVTDVDMPMTEQSEKILVSLAKRGDMASFEQLVLAHEKMVYNIALRMFANSEDAKDVSQEVFLKVYRNLQRFNERASFSTWVYRITVNACIDEMRRRKGKPGVSLEQEMQNEEGAWALQVADERETPEQALLRREKQREVLLALEKLSPEHKAVVILRDIRGLSYEEISELLEMPLGTVKSRICRARGQLKEEILKNRERNGVSLRQKKGKGGRFHEM